MSTCCCPLHYIKHICSHWWSFRPLFHGLQMLRAFTRETSWRRRAIAALDLQPGEKVLDLCSGLGDDLRLLVNSKIEITAADKQLLYAEATRQEIRDNRWHNIRSIHWNTRCLPFADEHFDAVLVTYGMTGSEDPITVIEEAKRLLKPGGRIVVLDWVEPGKYNRLLNGLLWPLHTLMGCNPFNSWVPQLSKTFEVTGEKSSYCKLMKLVIAKKKS